MRRRTVLGGLLGAAVLAAVPVGLAARRDLSAARARVADPRARAIASRAGAMQYADAGKGPPVLVLHGTGGGFDQGLALAAPLIGHGWRLIAPSRFGYLGSDMPPDASSEAQADALVDLLDALDIARLPVLGGSAGAMPALAFALRYPDRCSALVALVPAVYAPGRSNGAAPPPAGLWAMQVALRSDLLFWAALKLAPGRMTGSLLATDPALVAAASPTEQARVRSLRDGLLPVSARARGLMNDALLAGHPAPMELGRITVPTLAIACADDRFDTLTGARHIVAEVPGARLVSYPTGGHVMVGRTEAIFAEIDGFLRAAG